MRYSKFKREVEKLDLEVMSNQRYIDVAIDKTVFLEISKENQYTMNADFWGFQFLASEIKRELFRLATELASTPLDEREDEKRYRLKLPFAMKYDSYLNLCSDGFFVSSKDNSNDCKTIFTESEIEELKRKYNLDSFVLGEVLENE